MGNKVLLLLLLLLLLLFDRTLFHPIHSGLVLIFFGCPRFRYLHSDPVLPQSKTQGLALKRSHVTKCSALIDRDEMLIYVLRSDWLWSISAPSTTKQETAKVPTLQTLKHVILRGWPENSSSVPKGSLSVFWDERAVQNGIFFKGQWCLIPTTERQKVKEKIHRAHIGIQGCLRKACEVVYWPSMNQEISDYIEHCNTCNMYTSHSQWKPLIVHDVPERPWQKVGCDIFTLDEKDYLCTVDYLVLWLF